MLLKKKFLIFIFIVLLIFSLLTYQGIKNEDVNSPELPLNPLMLVQREISYLTGGVKDFFTAYILIAGKEKENRILTEQIKKTEQERNQLQESRYENERLRELLELKTQRADFITSAEVFARDPTNWFQSLWINKGSNDRISKDMIAVTPRGVVGRVHRALKDISNIVLVTDINSSVAARIQSSRVDGILEGSGDTISYLKYVSRDEGVAVGDKIITSGLDGIFPEGLHIGFIADVRKKSGDLFHVIEVSTAQNLNSVEEVAILKK
jgi:rod shape-determining protein MreC